MQGLAFSNIETFFDNKMALSLVSWDKIQAKNIPPGEVSGGQISPILNRVSGWEISATLFEVERDRVRVSLRTHDAEKYDVSKLAAAFGGGGHKAAAGILMLMPLEEAKNAIVSKAKEMYNL